jgi:hypothetical protein
MPAPDIETYRTEMEMKLYQEYQEVAKLFRYAVETDRRFYLANSVDLKIKNERADVYYELTLLDAWSWDIFRPTRFLKSVHVLTFRDVNIEELQP